MAMVAKFIFIVLLVLAATLFAYNSQAKVVNEHIYIVPAGDADKKIISAISKALPENLPMTVSIRGEPAKEITGSAYDPSRKQYDADAVLRGISKRIVLDTRMEAALIIADVDLYSKDLNFVFGIADPRRSTALISITRLKNEFYGLKPDNKLLLKRVLKEALHELGHAWGLAHCGDMKCVMSFSDTLADTDRKRAYFCHNHRTQLVGRYIGPPLVNVRR